MTIFFVIVLVSLFCQLCDCRRAASPSSSAYLRKAVIGFMFGFVIASSGAGYGFATASVSDERDGFNFRSTSSPAFSFVHHGNGHYLIIPENIRFASSLVGSKRYVAVLGF